MQINTSIIKLQIQRICQGMLNEIVANPVQRRSNLQTYFWLCRDELTSPITLDDMTA